MGVGIVILVFFGLVIVHELGHFLIARWTGTRVEEFGLGIPPRIATVYTDAQGTAYTLNLLPLGGFVKIAGDNPHEEGAFVHKHSFQQRTRRQKILILIGGVTVNLFVGWMLLIAAFMIGANPFIVPAGSMPFATDSHIIMTTSQAMDRGYITSASGDVVPVITMIQPDSHAAQLGLSTGDTITAINGSPVTNDTLSEAITPSHHPSDSEYTVVVTARTADPVPKEKIIQYTCTPRDPSTCRLGIGYNPMMTFAPQSYPRYRAVPMASSEIVTQGRIMIQGLGYIGSSLVSQDQQKIRQAIGGVAGPVGMTHVGAAIHKHGGSTFLFFIAVLSITLGFFNLLPIPVLDGGRILSVLLQRILPVSKEKFFRIESYLNAFFFIAFMILGVLIMIKDIAVIL